MPANAVNDGSELSGVSCPTTSFCTVVGYYDDTSSTADGLILTWAGDAWTAAEAPLPASAAAGAAMQLSGVSCSSASACAAVGDYGTSTSITRGVLLMYSGGSWTAGEAPLPPGAGDVYTELHGVSCPSATSCTAVGYINSSVGNGLLLSWANDAWTAAVAPLPADKSSLGWVTLYGVSCSSPSKCVAVGTYNDASSNQPGLLLTFSGGKWTPTEAPLPPNAAAKPFAMVEGVSCPSPSFCSAAGLYDDTAGSSNGLLLTSSS